MILIPYLFWIITLINTLILNIYLLSYYVIRFIRINNRSNVHLFQKANRRNCHSARQRLYIEILILILAFSYIPLVGHHARTNQYNNNL